MFVSAVKVDSNGSGYTSAAAVTILDATGIGMVPPPAFTDIGAVTAITLTTAGSGYITSGGIKKFQDGLPMLCNPLRGLASDNNLGQYMPLAVPDTTTFAAADYYVIALVQHREQMNSSLPATGTLLREYVQLETAGQCLLEQTYRTAE